MVLMNGSQYRFQQHQQTSSEQRSSAAAVNAKIGWSGATDASTRHTTTSAVALTGKNALLAAASSPFCC